MQLFVLDDDPYTAGRYYYDTHVIKILVEAAQMMCTAYPAGVPPYKHTHVNHRCAKWVRECSGNFRWTLSLAYSLAHQYTKRFNKTHKTSNVLAWIDLHKPEIPNGYRTPFVQNIPEELRLEDPVLSYRKYYMTVKRHLAKWTKTEKPDWWK